MPANYQCTSCCDKTFKSPSALRRHENKGQLNVPCNWPGCGKRFSQKSALDDHIRIKHTDEKPRACPFCPRHFSASYQVNEHMSSHHAECLWRCASALAKDGSCFYGGSRDGKKLAKHIELKHGNSRFEQMAVPPVKPLHAYATVDLACPIARAALNAFYPVDQSEYYVHSSAPPSVDEAPDTDFAAWTGSPVHAMSTAPLDQSPSSSWSSFTSSPLPIPPEDLSVLEQQIAGFFNGWTPAFTDALQQSTSLDFSIPYTLPSPTPYSCQTSDSTGNCIQDNISSDFASYAQLDTIPTPLPW